MGFKQQLKGLLKSEFIIIKRNKFLSSIELFCPIVLLIFFLFVRLSFKTEKDTYESLFKNDLEFIFKYGTNLTNHIDVNNLNEMNDINENTPLPYNYFLAQCNNIKKIALIGENFPQKLIDKISSHYWEMEDFNKNEIFKKFESIKEFEEYITSKDYGADDILNPKICFGISQTDKFQFGIHYNTINIDNDNSNDFENLLSKESPHIPDMKSNKNEKIKNQEQLKFLEYYKNSGYLMTLKIIYDYILEEITEDPNAEINFSVFGMKFDEILKDNFHRFLNLLGFFIIISYSIIFSINIYREIHFKETKKKEYLKSMGMKEIVFFISSFIRFFIINLFHSIFCALFVKLILKQSQYIYLFFIFLLFGLVIFSMIFFFQSFLNESRIGVIISLLCFCIMSFFYLPIDSPEVDKSFRNFICILFPQANLLLGFNTFYVFEKEFSPLNNRVNLDISNITISLMITFLFISFIIYLILGFIIFQFWGIKKKCCSKKKSFIYNDDDISNYNSKEDTDLSIKNKYNYNNSRISSKRANRISNPPKNQNNNINNDDFFNNLGKYYDDNDIPEQKSIEEKNVQKNKKIENEKDIFTKNITLLKCDYNDYINSLAKKEPKQIIEKKKENLKLSIYQLVKDKKENAKNSNPYFLDECEMDIDNQIEFQEMRNKRRLGKSTMYNLKPEEHYINDNLKLSEIKCIIDEPNINKSINDLIDLFNNNNNEDNTNSSNNNSNLISNNNSNNVSNNIPNNNSNNIPNNNSNINVRLKKKEIRKRKEDLHVGAKLEIKNIKKKYENEEFVLNNLSFNLYENEIFTLLGPNGAGKSTFISVLSGLEEPNSGNIQYEDKDQGINIDFKDPKFKKIVGICHQNNNILYDELTVEENLEIFCLFKYDKKINGSNEKYTIKEEVKKLIKDFQLEEEKKNLAKNLSGGFKRRLAIAIAFSGRSKIIVLDEPTGGIDIISKKCLWNIIKDNKNKKIILLITHYMDEAWFLSDKIGIINKGRIICSGTYRELIDNYGKYITIEINKKIDDKVKEVIKYINKEIIIKENDKSYSLENNNLITDNTKNMIDPSTTSLSVKSDTSIIKKEKVERKVYKEKVVIKIPTRLFNYSKINDMIKNFEEVYNIKDYKIKKDQLEDAFVNTIKVDYKDDKKDYIILSKMDEQIDEYNWFGKFKNELKILFKKRGYETLRDKKSFVLEIIFPILLTFISCIVSYIEILEDNKSSLIELNTFSNETQSIYYGVTNITKFEDFQLLNNDGQKEKEKLQNYHFKYLHNVGIQKNYNLIQHLTSYLNVIYEYTKKENILNNSANFYLIEADKKLHKYEFASFISTRQRHSPIAYTNYLLNSIIRYEIKQNVKYNKYLDNVTIVNSPFHLSYEEKNNKKSRNGFVFVFFISIALSLIPSNFITIIIREKEKKSKNLQLLSGLSIYTYWINNYIFEFIKYYIVVGICLIIISIFKFYEKYLIIFYLFYGPALVSFTYFVSYFFNSQGVGQTCILIINLIFGALGGSAVLIMRTNQQMKKLGISLSYIFRFIPSFCISYGYNQLISKKLLFAIDYYKKDINDNEEIENIKKKYNDSSNIIKDKNYISNDIIFLVFEIFVYTGLLILFEKKDYFLWKFGLKKIKNIDNYDNNSKNANYKEECGPTSRREEIINEEKKENYFPLDVIKLEKSYEEKKGFFNCCKKKKKLILNSLSFKVQNEECYGLLGKNGEGKSTTFKCLCKEIEPDNGLVKINEKNIYDFSSKNESIIGYCPQFDSIFDYLTVKENLIFYGRLKGIYEFSLENIVEIIIKKLDLNKYSNKLSGYLSGGNKRKLSVGISILSKPCVILMDEPSTGMDPYTRRLLMDFLYKAYLKNYGSKNNNPCSIVLTTHSIEEAEALCDKIGFLHKGKLVGNKRISSFVKDKSKIKINIEFRKPLPEELKSEFGNILGEKIDDENEIKKLLSINKKNKYNEYLKRDHFGRDILKVLKLKKSINKYTILRWVKYMDYLMELVKKIKDYFNYIHCKRFKLNSFILEIKNIGNKDKNDNYIVGIIEKYKDLCHIEEYSYELTTLENVFIEYCKQEEEESEHIIENRKNKQKAIDISL